MYDKIFPMAFEPKPELQQHIYYLNFPKAWKSELFELLTEAGLMKGDYYNLPTRSLARMINSWMDGVVRMQPLSRKSDDSNWLLSAHAFGEEEKKELIKLIRLWLRSLFRRRKDMPQDLQERTEAFCRSFDSRRPELLKQLCCRSEEICLSRKDGSVTSEAYDLLPLLAINKLSGRQIEIENKKFNLLYAGKKQIISLPAEVSGKQDEDLYSFVLDFSVQNLPPAEKPLLVCHISVRRWIAQFTAEAEQLYLPKRINALIKTSEDKLYPVPVRYVKASAPGKKGRIDWDPEAAEIYKIRALPPLPQLKEVLSSPRDFARMACRPCSQTLLKEQAAGVLLPYSNGMKSAFPPKVGSGITMRDKDRFMEILQEVLSPYVKGIPKTTRVTSPRQPLKVFNDMKEMNYDEDFVSWFIRCLGSSELRIEIYCLKNDPRQMKLAEIIQKRITGQLCPADAASPLKLQCEILEIGSGAADLNPPGAEGAVIRSHKFLGKLGEAKIVTGCICIIPDAGSYKTNTDPKQALRSAFGRSGRVVQFMNIPSLDEEPLLERLNDESRIIPAALQTAEPSAGAKESSKELNALLSKIEKSIADLYRQLGVIMRPDPNVLKKHPLAKTSVVAVHVLSAVRGKNYRGIARVPVFIHLDIKRIFGEDASSSEALPLWAESELFGPRKLSYREALIELSKLYFDPLFDRTIKGLSAAPMERKLTQLRSLFRSPSADEDAVLVLLRHSKAVYDLWSGITNSAISQYPEAALYVPERIKSGGRNEEKTLSLLNSGVRIIRFRDNAEVPDYYTPLSQKSQDSNQKQYATVSGIFTYANNFWSVSPKPNDVKYNRSLKSSRIDLGKKDCAEKDMIEIYPVQLQENDDPRCWIFCAKQLCELSLQYDQATRLPMPLHLAVKMEEYLFDPYA